MEANFDEQKQMPEPEQSPEAEQTAEQPTEQPAQPQPAPEPPPAPEPRAGRSLKIPILAGGAIAAALFLAWALFIGLYPDAAKVISFGVRVGSVPVGGLKKAAALERLSSSDEFKVPKELRIKADTENFVVAMKELHYRYDLNSAVDNAYAIGREKGLAGKLSERVAAAMARTNLGARADYDTRRLKRLVEVVAERTNRRAKDATMNWDTLEFVPYVVGRKVDRKTTLGLLREALYSYHGEKVSLPVTKKIPKEKGAKYKGVDFKNPLATYSTKFNEGLVNRSKNLRRIGELLTGHEIKPDTTFSYNEVVGERTRENGFFLAPEIQNGRHVEGWGGGACQGSTTLFNAALLADMNSFEWSPHSQASAYVDPGRDATVYYDKIDFKFHNPHKESVFLHATATHGVLTMTMFSRHKLKYKIEISSKWWGRFWPGEKEILNPDLPPGTRNIVSKGASGMHAALYRTYIYPGGKKKEHRVTFGDRKDLRYPGAKRIVEVGPEEKSSEDTED